MRPTAWLQTVAVNCSHFAACQNRPSDGRDHHLVNRAIASASLASLRHSQLVDRLIVNRCWNVGRRAVENRVCGRMIDAVFGHRCAAHRAYRFTHFFQNRIVGSQIRWTNRRDQFMVQPVDETDEFFPCTTLVDASLLIHGVSVRFIRSLQGVDRAGTGRARVPCCTPSRRGRICRRHTLPATQDGSPTP